MKRRYYVKMADRLPELSQSDLTSLVGQKNSEITKKKNQQKLPSASFESISKKEG